MALKLANRDKKLFQDLLIDSEIGGQTGFSKLALSLRLRLGGCVRYVN